MDHLLKGRETRLTDGFPVTRLVLLQSLVPLPNSAFIDTSLS
jgi:hypothetical protein